MTHPDPTQTSLAAPQIPDRTIALVGLMGAGKSAVGKRLADVLQLSFIDTDHEIERAAGMTIADIFEHHGEAAFRDGERKVIRRLMEPPAKVLATGGGAFMDRDTRTLLLSEAITVWLDADLDTLVERVSRRSNRPLLERGDKREILRDLMEKRNPVYAEAAIRVVSTSETIDAMVRRVKEAIDDYRTAAAAQDPS
ncbi:MAG: shikimate kinase [Alphaproteobacteria bacterium]|nr:shikimate kinase [Alphaproteobacteria bacterium]